VAGADFNGQMFAAVEPAAVSLNIYLVNLFILRRETSLAAAQDLYSELIGFDVQENNNNSIVINTV
jgi:hypothetical protein